MSNLRRTVQWGPPVWTNTPAPTFTHGTASTYSLAPFVFEPSGTGYTLSAVGTLPAGVTLSGTSLVYSGAGTAGETASVQIRATATGGASDSASFAVTLTASGGVTLLSPSDITYLGYYDQRVNGNDSAYQSALAVRKVGSEVRLFTKNLNRTVVEFSLAGRNYGDTITTTVGAWDLTDSFYSALHGLWWDEANSRLWALSAASYTVSVNPVRIYTHALGPAGSFTRRGPFGLAGINAKRCYGGALSVPAAFQAQYGVGPYMVGFGGYTSLVAQGGGASLGPTLYAIPEPTTYLDGAEIPQSDFKIGSDFGLSNDRGRRLSRSINYFDGADPRQNPSTRPTEPPLPGSPFQSPAPDGLNYWTYTDRTAGAVFIQTATKRGILMVTEIRTGYVWYQTSDNASDGLGAEIHFYNPDDVGAIINGTALRSSLRPSSMMDLPQLSRTAPPGVSFTGYGDSQLMAAAYEPIDRRLYVIMFGKGADIFTSRIYVYQVNA